MSSCYLKFRIGIPDHYIRTVQERQGMIELYDQIDIYDILINKVKYNVTKTNNVSTEASQQFTKLCLLDIPSNMIPNEIIRFFRSSIDDVSSINIYRHIDYAQKYVGIIELKNNTAANRFIEQYQNILLSSKDDCYCFLYPVKTITYDIDINHNTDIFSTLNGHHCDSTTTNNKSILNSIIIKNNDYDTIYHNSNHDLDSNPLSNVFITSRGPSPLMQQYQHQPLQHKLSHDEIHSFNHFLPIYNNNYCSNVYGGGGGATNNNSVSSYVVDGGVVDNEDNNQYIIIKKECENIGSNQGRSLISPDKTLLNCDEEFCSVCLDIINKIHPMSFTTCCSHTFHIQCISQLERPQCPVCRFQHDDINLTSKTYSCYDCGWYGLCNNNNNNELQQIFNDSNSNINTKINSKYLEEASQILSNDSNVSDVWICLVCGFTGCGISNLGHIKTHYESTLHTYAMNTDTRQMWDFARDGYVHRLILNTPIITNTNNTNSNNINNKNNDNSELYFSNNNVDNNSHLSIDNNITTNLSNSIAATTNIINDKYNSEQQKLSPQEKENLIINNKLEVAAYNYNQILAWQMEQNRMLYMTRVQRIRDSAGMINHNISTATTATIQTNSNNEINNNHNNNHLISSTTITNSTITSNNNHPKHDLTIHMNEKNWRDNMIISLESEKMKLLKQVDNIKERGLRNMKENEVIKELNNSLKKNQIEWEQRLQVATDLYIDNENAFKHQKSILESKVNELMSKLDEVQRTDTGRKYTSNNNPTTNPST